MPLPQPPAMSLQERYEKIQTAQSIAEQVTDPETRRVLLQAVAVCRVIVVTQEVDRVMAEGRVAA